MWITVLVIARDAIIVVMALVLHLAHGVGSFPPSWISKVNTVAQVSAVVGQRQRRHPGRLGGVQDVTDPIGAVEQAVLAVKVEVDEVRHPGDYPTALSRGAPSRRAAMRLARTM